MIYFIQAGETGLIKIGYSYSPEQRLAKLQTASPIPLKILMTIDGDMDFEARLHRKFNDFRAESGEWFYPVKPIKDFIKLYSNGVFTKEQRRVFALDKSMIDKPQLFDLTLKQLFYSPPIAKIDEYRILVREVLLETIAWTRELEENGMILTDDIARRAVNADEKFVNEVSKLSPVYKKWMSQVSEGLEKEIQ